MLQNISCKRECPLKWYPHLYRGRTEAGFIVSLNNFGRGYQNFVLMFFISGGRRSDFCSVIFWQLMTLPLNPQRAELCLHVKVPLCDSVAFYLQDNLDQVRLNSGSFQLPPLIFFAGAAWWGGGGVYFCSSFFVVNNATQEIALNPFKYSIMFYHLGV